MKNTPESLESVRTGTAEYLDRISNVTKFSPPPPEQVDELADAWEKRSLELGLGTDYNQVPSRLRKHKVEQIAIGETNLAYLRQLSQELVSVLDKMDTKDVSWRLSLYMARKKLRDIL